MAREVLKFPTVESVTVCDIDEVSLYLVQVIFIDIKN